MNYADEAERHRLMAEQCRTMAACVHDDGLRVEYRNLAKAYDQLADREMQLVRNLKTSN